MKQDLMIALVLSPFIAYFAYQVIKDALKEPPVTTKRMSYGTDDDGNPVYDDDMDIDATLSLWREQNRLIRSSCA